MKERAEAKIERNPAPEDPPRRTHDLAISPEIENLSLTVTQEIRVNASIEVTFESLLEQLVPTMNCPMARPCR